MTKVLIVQPTVLPVGGGAIAQQFTRSLLEKLKFDVYSISFCGTQVKNERHYTKALMSKYKKKIHKYSFNSDVYYFLNSTIKEVRPDIIIVGQLWSYFSVLFCLWKYRQIPKINIIHTAEMVCLNSFLTKKINSQPCDGKVGVKCIRNNCVSKKISIFRIGFHYALKFSIKSSFDHFICHSKYMHDLLYRINITNVTLIPLSIPDTMKIPTIDKIQIDKTTELLFVGSLEWHKGIEELINSLLILKERTTKFHLTVIGDGSLMNKLQNFIIESDLTKFVSLKGIQKRDELFKYYNHSDIVVFPSYFESYGLVALEAMMFNKKIIVSNRGALPELVIDYPLAITLNSIDPLEIANCISKSMGRKKNNIEYSRTTIYNVSARLDSVISNLLEK